jgi:predicted nucleotidyltransferase
MTKTEQKIIKLLADYPEREFYGQEIAKKTKTSKASVSGTLKLLSGKSIVFKKTKGRMKFYQINQKSPELKKFRINLALGKINPLLSQLKKFSQKIIFFGSASRGEQTFGSDLDLFILSTDKNKLQAVLKKISRSGIKALIKTQNEWSEMEIKEPEFYQEVKNGIILYEHVPRI